MNQALKPVDIFQVSGETPLVLIDVLQDGVDFLVAIIGAYALSEVFSSYAEMNVKHEIDTKRIGRVMITREDWNRIKTPIIRSTPVAFLLGCLPDSGNQLPDTAAFCSHRRLLSR